MIDDQHHHLHENTDDRQHCLDYHHCHPLHCLKQTLDSNSGAQLSAHYDKDLVRRVLQTKQEEYSWSFTLAKLGCLLCLTKHPLTRAELIKLGGTKLFEERSSDSLLSYFNSLCLAHLLAGDDNNCDREERQKCLEFISDEFKKLPRAVRDKESNHGVVWTSTKHLGRLLVDKEEVLRHLGLFSLANLSYGDYNRTLILHEEGMLEYATCMQWSDEGPLANERKEQYYRTITSNFGPTTNFVPSLAQICLYHIFSKFRYLVPKLERVEIIPPWIDINHRNLDEMAVEES
eukprot:TRINITY_DN4089_c0_g1_i9.p1 TRINITY_DN4089_c0_g1~~TRINITY_DN4089_c0_g1_i9.p1  ORF type:complete len:289 (-),score=51.94 TRINITY_DN4089_c0_g1_i9:377-1243(-)